MDCGEICTSPLFQFVQLNLPDGVQSRCYHTITAISLGPGLTEATVFGGCSKWIPGVTYAEHSKHSIAETTVLQFGEHHSYHHPQSSELLLPTGMWGDVKIESLVTNHVPFSVL